MNRGIVLKMVDERTAVVLTTDLAYVRVPRLPGMEVGAEVDVDAEAPHAGAGRSVRRRRLLTGRRRFSWPAVAAACLIAATALTTVQVRSAWAKPYAYVSLDVNPSVELTLNAADHVVGVTVLDASSARAVRGLQLEGLTIHKALARYAARLVAEGYMKSGRAAVIVATAPAGNGALSSAVNADVQMAVQRTFKGANVQIASLVVPEGVLKSALSYRVSPGRLALYVEAKRMGMAVSWRDIVYGHLARAVGGEAHLASLVKRLQSNQMLALELSRIEPQSPSAVKQSMRQLLRVVETQAEQDAGNAEKRGEVGPATNRASGRGRVSTASAGAGGKADAQSAAGAAKAKVNVHIVSTQHVAGGAPVASQEAQTAKKPRASTQGADGAQAEAAIPSPPVVPESAGDHAHRGGGTVSRHGLVDQGKGLPGVVVGGDHPSGHDGGTPKKRGDGGQKKQGDGKQGSSKQDGDKQRGSKIGGFAYAVGGSGAGRRHGHPEGFDGRGAVKEGASSVGRSIPSARVTTPGAAVVANDNGKQADTGQGDAKKGNRKQGDAKKGDGTRKRGAPGASATRTAQGGGASGLEVMPKPHAASEGKGGGRLGASGTEDVSTHVSDKSAVSSGTRRSQPSGRSDVGKIASEVKQATVSVPAKMLANHTRHRHRLTDANANGHKHHKHRKDHKDHKHQTAKDGRRGQQSKKSDQQTTSKGSGDGNNASQGVGIGISASAESGGTVTGASVSAGGGAASAQNAQSLQDGKPPGNSDH